MKRMSLRDLKEALRDMGFEVLRTRGGHDMWHNPAFDALASTGAVSLPPNLIKHKGGGATSLTVMPRHEGGDGVIMAIFKKAQYCANQVDKFSRAFATAASPGMNGNTVRKPALNR